MVADERFKMATSALDDAGMFGVQAAEASQVGVFTLKQSELIFNTKPVVFLAFADVLQHTVDAIQLWTPVRRHEQG